MKIINAIPKYEQRTSSGFAVYVLGMENSSPEKKRLMPYVNPGVILEVGCGGGAVLEILSKHFPDSCIVGTDISDSLIKESSKRQYANGNVHIIKANACEKPFQNETLDTVIFCSVIHEIFTYDGYCTSGIEDAIEAAYQQLKPKGRIIIRDGIKPESKTLYLKFKNSIVEQKFYHFAEEFGPHKISFKQEGGYFAVASEDAFEFLSKYFYDENWYIEVKEQFGVYTKEECAALLKRKGFNIVHAESYLIDFLHNKYLNDVEVFEKRDGVLVPTQHPDSTMIVIGEKT